MAAQAWTAAQQARRRQLLRPARPAALPPHAERAMRYSAATFGAYFLAGLAVARSK